MVVFLNYLDRVADMTSQTDDERPQALARPLRALRRDADDRPRRDDRERRPAHDPGRPGLLPERLAWVVNAYLIPFGGLLLLAGRLGDLLGQRTIFLIGLGVFIAASLLCAVAESQAMLIAARFVQGVGGALASAVILGMIVTMFPEPREQAKAIGVYGFVASAGGSIGLLLGGVLTQAINWHWIFVINLPIGIATAYWPRAWSRTGPASASRPAPTSPALP